MVTYVWRCLTIYKRATEFVTNAALNLARGYYGDSKLKRKNVKSTKSVDLQCEYEYHVI